MEAYAEGINPYRSKSQKQPANPEGQDAPIRHEDEKTKKPDTPHRNPYNGYKE